jgi:hypothetical protein
MQRSGNASANYESTDQQPELSLHFHEGELMHARKNQMPRMQNAEYRMQDYV